MELEVCHRGSIEALAGVDRRLVLTVPRAAFGHIASADLQRADQLGLQWLVRIISRASCAETVKDGLRVTWVVLPLGPLLLNSTA